MATLPLDDELVSLLAETELPLEQAVRKLLVFGLYQRGIIGTGRGARLLGMERLAFIQETGSLGIPYFQYDEGELEREIEAIDRFLARDEPPHGARDTGAGEKPS